MERIRSALAFHEGRCPLPGRHATQIARDAYLSSFRQIPPLVEGRLAALYVAPEVTEEDAGGVQRWVGNFSADIEPPAIYVYPNAEALRAHASVHENAVAYYDGAIHLSAGSSLVKMRESFDHEYIHHRLFARGITGPPWLHEGLAMRYSGERRNWRPHDGPLDLSVMNSEFSQEASAEFADDFYGQSLAMVNFLYSLCEAQTFNAYEVQLTSVDACRSKEGLIEPLLSGVPAEALFVSAVEERTVSLQASALSLWSAYLENGQRLDQETFEELRRNARRVVERSRDTNWTRHP